MLRGKLEPKIDTLLSEKLRQQEFLSRVVDEFNTKTQEAAGTAAGRFAIERKLTTLETKKQRILEAFFDGAIDKSERDSRIAQVGEEISSFQKILLDIMPAPEVRSDEIAEALEPLAEWEFLEREDKRALLSVLCPEIRVDRYVVKSLMLNLLGNGCDDDSPNRAAGASLRGHCARTPAARQEIAPRDAQAKLHPAGG